MDETIKKFIDEEEHGGDGGENDVDGNKFHIHHDCLVINSEDSNIKYVEIDNNDEKERSIGFVDLTIEGITKVIG